MGGKEGGSKKCTRAKFEFFEKFFYKSGIWGRAARSFAATLEAARTQLAAPKRGLRVEQPSEDAGGVCAEMGEKDAIDHASPDRFDSLSGPDSGLDTYSSRHPSFSQRGTRLQLPLSPTVPEGREESSRTRERHGRVTRPDEMMDGTCLQPEVDPRPE